jgi:hypothetical protein
MEEKINTDSDHRNFNGRYPLRDLTVYDRVIFKTVVSVNWPGGL